MKQVDFSKEQAREFALDIFDVLIRDIKAEENEQIESSVVKQCRLGRRSA